MLQMNCKANEEISYLFEIKKKRIRNKIDNAYDSIFLCKLYFV